MAETKICTLCRQVKPLSEFVRSARVPDGYTKRCKSCHNRNARERRAANPHDHYRRFLNHRGDAKRRGIPFLLTFDQWLEIWMDSGHINESGARKGQYCMARFGDNGPYDVGNVRICTVTENHQEMRHDEEKKAAMRGNEFALGRKHAPETLEKIRSGSIQMHRRLGHQIRS